MRISTVFFLFLFISCNTNKTKQSVTTSAADTVFLKDTTESAEQIAEKTPVQEDCGYQTVAFKELDLYPNIRDTTAFIQALEKNCHICESPLKPKFKTINYFKKIRIYGSKKYFYLLEYDFHDGSNAEFPWKEQFLFDQKGKLVNTFWSVWIDTVTILKNEKPFLFSMGRTAHGNGGHMIQKMQADTLETVYGRDDEYSPQTFASGYGLFENIPNELHYKISDDNKDRMNDVVFFGKVRYSKFDLGQQDKIVPVRFIFLYNKYNGHFVAKENYQNKYAFIYGND